MYTSNCKKAAGLSALLQLSLLLTLNPITPAIAQTGDADYTTATKEDCTNEAGGCQQIVDYGGDGIRDQLAYLNGVVCYNPIVPTTAAATPAAAAKLDSPWFNSPSASYPPPRTDGRVTTDALTTYYGQTGDVSVPGDCDGDTKTDFAVWRPSDGTWYYLSSLNGWGYNMGAHGDPTDVPVQGDYDGDGITDRMIWRPVNGHWYVYFDGATNYSDLGEYGTDSHWTPLAGDYDGDGKTDLALYEPNVGDWFARFSTDGQSYFLGRWGGDFSSQAGSTYYYVPVVGDWDGDHKYDLALFTVAPGFAENGTWYASKSSLNFNVTVDLGVCGDHRYQVSYQYYPPNYLQPTSPIAIDTAADGFALTDSYNGVAFDITGTGIPLQIGWTNYGTDDAFLALDRNGNGRIDSGKELFGNFTDQPTTSREANGFAALALFDRPANGGNSDGIIDRRDSIYEKLRLWKDTDRNGISSESELFKLAELGVGALELKYEESRRWDEWGNQFRFRAAVRDMEGAQVGRRAYDVFLVNGPLKPVGQNFNRP